MKMYTSL